MADKTKYNAFVEQLKSQLIVDIEQLQATSAFDLNIDENKLIYACVNAQKLYLEPLIGSALVRKLQNDDLTFEYDLLKEKFLNDAIINWGCAESIQGLALSISNGGIFKHTSTDSEVASAGEVTTLRQTYLYKGDEFGRRLIAFLNKNSSYYPEYSENSADGLNARKKQLFTGGLQIENTSYVEECSGGVGNADASLFVANVYWGNNAETAMGFDQTTLSESSSTVPNSVMAMPVNNYFWLVSDVELYLGQVGTLIPMSSFDDVDQLTQIFVKGEQDGLFWIRIKIADVYENAVQFSVSI